MATQRSRAALFTIVNIVAAAAVYSHLITGGWLTNHYHLNDPNIINLALAIFELLTLVGVVAYWVWRTKSLYRLIITLAMAQLLVGVGFLLFFLIFALTWHPKLM